VSGAQGGLMMILAAVVLFVLWQRGYLATWIAGITAGLSGTTVAKPLTLSLTTASPTNGRYAGKPLPL
jgi:hypothetical protein